MIEPTLIEVSSTTSTSSLALQYLRQGQQPPFAVFARQQTGGRGRGGRQWDSPDGNLYLSLIFATTPHPLLSLHSVNLTCEWLKTIGIVPTCKWPNDLLYNGKKLAGLLCEGSDSRLIIGIGINVNVVPPTVTDRATSLKKITDKDYDVKTLARSLFEYFCDTFDNQGQIVEQFEQLTTNIDELWSDNERFYLREPDFTNGHLQLKPLTEEDRITVNSADNSYRLVYQSPCSLPLIVADIGNSAIKIALFVDDQLQTYSASDRQTLTDHLSQLRKKILPAVGKQWLIYCGSVNSDNRQLLNEVASVYGFILSDLKTTNHFLYRGKQYPLEQLGIDRLAAIEAYLAEDYEPQHTGIIVNFGTATTVDLIASNSGEHLGGYICAGLQLMLDSLAQYSELPALQLTDVDQRCGTTTEEAIVNGALSMQLSWLKDIVRNHQPAKVVVSGGYHKAITDHLDHPYHLDRTLVLKGLKAMVWR